MFSWLGAFLQDGDWLVKGCGGAGVVGELREGDKPAGPRLNLLRSSARKRRLGGQEVDDRADPLPVATEGNALRLLGTGEEVRYLMTS